MANLAVTYGSLGKYTKSEKLEIQVLDARNRIFAVQHPQTILAMENLTITLGSLEKSEEAQKLIIQAQELKNKVLLATSQYAIATMANAQEAQDLNNEF